MTKCMNLKKKNKDDYDNTDGIMALNPESSLSI